MQRVLDHIDAHLAGDLALDSVASVAAFSKHHFHRQFSATFGLSLHRYVQLARLKRASYQLAFRSSAVTDIAMDAGYEAPEAFARAFRQRFGQAPSDFRKSPDWEPWLVALGPLDAARSHHMQSYDSNQVTITDFPETPVAILAHRGPQSGIHATIQRFIAWRKANALPPSRSATFNIFHTEPDADDFHLDLCAATAKPVAPNESGVESGAIPAGRCAMLRLTGSSDNLEPAASWLYREWLPQSGEEPRDFPLFCRRVTFFPDVPEHEAVTELYLPLA
ncbi:MAG: AraC family transcriptional regulator [Pseudomonadota bacterium]